MLLEGILSHTVACSVADCKEIQPTFAIASTTQRRKFNCSLSASTTASRQSTELPCCSSHAAQVISAFGAGGHLDPSKLRVADLVDMYGDPLGKVIRKGKARLALSCADVLCKGLFKEKVRDGILCCFLTNPNDTRQKLLPLSDNDFNELQTQKIARPLRARVLPVTMAVPTAMGMAMANAVLNDIAGFPTIFPEDNTASVRLSSSKRSALLRMQSRANVQVDEEALLQRTAFVHHSASCCATIVCCISLLRSRSDAKLTQTKGSDLDFVFSQLFEGKSAISKQPATELVRWRDAPLSPTNIIPCTRAEALAHQPGKVEELYGNELVAQIDEMLGFSKEQS